MKRTIKYILLLLVIVLVGYKSVYFKKISELKNTSNEKFDAVTYSKKLWDEKLPAKLDSAIELTNLIKLIETNPTDAFAKHSNAMGIGNYRYSLVKISGKATEVNEDDIIMQINNADSLISIQLATEYI